MDGVGGDEAEAQRGLLLHSATALGVGTEKDLRDYFRLDPADSRNRLAELVEDRRGAELLARRGVVGLRRLEFGTLGGYALARPVPAMSNAVPSMCFEAGAPPTALLWLGLR